MTNKIKHLFLSALAAFGITASTFAAPVTPPPTQTAVTQSALWSNMLLNASTQTPGVSNNLYYGVGTWQSEFQAVNPARQPIDFVPVEFASFDPYFRSFVVLGDPPTTQDTNHVPLFGIDMPAFTYVTNSLNTNGIYVSFAQGSVTNVIYVSTSTNAVDWQWRATVKVANDGTLTLGTVSGTRPWINPTDNSLWLTMNVFTNGWQGNWADYAVKVDDSFTNLSHLTKIDLGDPNHTSYDVRVTSDPTSATNYVAWSSENEVGLSYTLTSPPTNGFVLIAGNVASGEGPNLMPNPWRLLVDPTLNGSGYTSLVPTGNVPGASWTVVGQETFPVKIRAAFFNKATTAREQADVLAAIARSATLNAGLESVYWATARIVTNGFTDTLTLVGDLDTTNGTTLVGNLSVTNSVRYFLGMLTNSVTLTSPGQPVWVVDYSAAPVTVTLPFTSPIGRQIRFEAWTAPGSTNVTTITKSSNTFNGHSSLVLTGGTWRSCTIFSVSNNTWNASVVP